MSPGGRGHLPIIPGFGERGPRPTFPGRDPSFPHACCSVVVGDSRCTCRDQRSTGGKRGLDRESAPEIVQILKNAAELLRG